MSPKSPEEMQEVMFSELFEIFLTSAATYNTVHKTLGLHPGCQKQTNKDDTNHTNKTKPQTNKKPTKKTNKATHTKKPTKETNKSPHQP